MRLKKIKLAGFKSFVDPTQLELTRPLVAVVGPNGCGKSNVIDAIRWVMGESSAKNLRGESLTDVIFNGSTARKPVGQATVELIFDNSDGSLGGEYASYAEISIKRQATRDNQSFYYLNGTRCRRRDITDIFLGTGLGPRSYAIIEQGMISRVIDAKPLELRAFFEEAAGISVYRKRRQETETRMRHTRENLERLQDIRNELEKQLARLERQAESARKYQEFKILAETLEIEVTTLRWKNINDKLAVQHKEIQNHTVDLEEKMSRRTRNDLDMEKLREKIQSESQNFSKIQAKFYDLGIEIGRTEQTLEHHKSREQQINEERLNNQENLKLITAEIQQDREKEQELQQKLSNLSPTLVESEQKLLEYTALLQEAESKLSGWNEAFEGFRNDAMQPQKTAEVEKARIEQLDKQSRDAHQQLQKLQAELQEWDLEKIKETVTLLEAQSATVESENKTHRGQLENVTHTLSELRTHTQTLNQEYDRIKILMQKKQGQLLSLEALQEAALGKSDTVMEHWLESSGLEAVQRLAQTLEVQPEYEKALETVLGMALQAVCIPALQDIADKIENFSYELKGSGVFLEKSHESPVASQQNEDPVLGAMGCPLLISKVKSPYNLSSLLSGIYIAESLQQALRLRINLKAHESVITKEGLWFGQHWFKVYGGTSETRGIIEREQEIKKLSLELTDINQTLEHTKVGIDSGRAEIQNLETLREGLYKTHQIQSNLLRDLSGKMSGATARLEHARHRVLKLKEEISVQEQKMTLAQEEVGFARVTLQRALDEMQYFSEKREALVLEGENLKAISNKISQEYRLQKDATHQIALKMENFKTQFQALQQGITRLQTQYQSMLTQNDKLNTLLQEITEPQLELQKTLEKLLAERHAVEIHLNEARQALEAEQQALKQLEKNRNMLELELEQKRLRLEELRIEYQGIEVRRETFQEKLQTAGVSAEEILKNLDTTQDERERTQKLEEVSKKIEGLGAINLAAIEEFKTESERKNYLDLQYKDLMEALEALENAIRKIDRETRTRFKETFDKVNQEFQTLFPRLFGGGQSYLELEGEDLLEAGVLIMARPPGKRNSSIQLLSGGEKALTAVALVFSIFQLNPAPFCMLDEVDAPLDDANVGRFCELVKHMSNTVQFIYVTHNKLSMEMAHHLIGVTMKEPGVSRLVSVDVARAYELATA